VQKRKKKMKNKWIATLVTIFVYSVAMMAFSSVQTTGAPK